MDIRNIGGSTTQNLGLDAKQCTRCVEMTLNKNNYEPICGCNGRELLVFTDDDKPICTIKLDSIQYGHLIKYGSIRIPVKPTVNLHDYAKEDIYPALAMRINTLQMHWGRHDAVIADKETSIRLRNYIGEPNATN
jgi:hypothetical protein